MGQNKGRKSTHAKLYADPAQTAHGPVWPHTPHKTVRSLVEVCLVSHPEGHAMLIVEDVVPKLMRVIGEIKDFLPRFKHLWQTHVRQDSFSDKSTWRLRLL